MNRGSGNRPYVHSNVDNFMGNVSIGLTNTVLAGMDINNSITVLEHVRNQLKMEADKFLMGMGVDTANAELLRLDNTYAGIAADIIQRKNIITSLIVSNSKGYINKTDFEKTLSKDNVLTEQILNLIGPLEEQVPVEKLAKIIAKSLGNADLTITQAGTKVNKFFNVDSSLGGQISQEYINQMDKTLRSSKGKIVEIVKKLLLASDISKKYDEATMVHSVDKFMSAFEKIFLDEAKKLVDFYPADFTPTDYINALRGELTSALTKDITEIRNAVGIINEDILAAVYKADKTVTITLTATGTKTEDEIISQFPNLSKMNTHHENTKQSQSDMVIENKEGMAVRAQSKTSLREYTLKGSNELRILNHLQRSVNIYNLLTSINATGFFPINNIDSICYAIANSLWFNTHVSVSGVRTAGHFDYKTASVGENLLSEVIDALNVALAQQIPSFMGISVDRTVDQIQADVKGSNIFYIENGYLVPTYIELDEIIQDLKNYAKELVNTTRTVRFTIERQGVSWAYSNATSFWLAKNDHDTYNSTPGYEQGEAVISSTSIHGNFAALLKFESYVLG